MSEDANTTMLLENIKKVETDNFPPPVAFPIGLIVGTAVTKATWSLFEQQLPTAWDKT